MELDQQVCSLDLAKRLKELGVKQESVWWWVDGKLRDGYSMEQAMDYYQDADEAISAFTVAELGEMVPQSVKKDEQLYYLTPSAGGNSLRAISYTTYRNGIGYFLTGHPVIYEKTEADARAKMVIYLLAKGLMPAPSPTPRTRATS